MSSSGYKITDAQFWAILRKNGGLFARTAKAIKRDLGEDITRQAVRARALNDPDQYRDILEEVKDTAEEVIQDIMRTGTNREKLKATEIYLRGPGKDRGYYDKRELTGEDGKPIKVKITGMEIIDSAKANEQESEQSDTFEA